MKKLFTVLLILSLSLSLCGCKGGCYESGSGELSIVATVFPAFDFAREVAGERASVCLLVPPGSESHSFEPTAQDILRIQNCDLLICNGGESEVWLEDMLESMDKDIPRVVMMDCVQTLEEEVKEGMQVQGHEHSEDEGHGHEPEYDEHVWLSLKNARTLCSAIAAALGELDPDNRQAYAAGTADYLAQLAALDERYQQAAEQAARNTLLFADRFPFRYLVDDYGLNYYAAFAGCSAESEASFETVSFLAGKVDALKLPVVLTIEGQQHKIAQTVV